MIYQYFIDIMNINIHANAQHDNLLFYDKYLLMAIQNLQCGKFNFQH